MRKTNRSSGLLLPRETGEPAEAWLHRVRAAHAAAVEAGDEVRAVDLARTVRVASVVAHGGRRLELVG